MIILNLNDHIHFIVNNAISHEEYLDLKIQIFILFTSQFGLKNYLIHKLKYILKF